MMLIYSKADRFFVGIFLLQLVMSAAQKYGKITKDIMEAVESHKFEKSVGVPAGETEALIQSTSSVRVMRDTKFCTLLVFLESGKAGRLQGMLVQNGAVRVDIVTKNITLLQPALEELGVTQTSCHEDEHGGMGCSAIIPQDKLADLKNIEAVITACVSSFKVNYGSVVTEGDIAMYADLSRAEFGRDGSNVTVCVISDSFNCTCLADVDIESGDLPPAADMNIVQDIEPYQYCDYWCDDDPDYCDYCDFICYYEDGELCFEDDDFSCPCCEGWCYYYDPICFPLCGIISVVNPSSNIVCIDEGRALMQIIHDVAPGANLVFAAPYGKYDMASIIDRFVEEGLCDIIVDDLLFYDEPFFLDGAIAKAAETAVNKNITYLTAAGNAGRNSWEAPFVDSGIRLYIDGWNTGNLHQFGTDEDGQPVVTQKLVLPNIDYNFVVIFQWDNVFASQSNHQESAESYSFLNIFLLKDDLASAYSYSVYPNLWGDPVEFFYINPKWWWPMYGEPPVAFIYPVIEMELAITLRDGPAPSLMKVIVEGPPIRFEMYESSSTIFGHANNAKACAVGAANYNNTPSFGVHPPEVEDFSSVGGTPIMFDKNNTRLSNPIIRNQPCFTGPDGGQITTNFLVPDPWGRVTSPITPNRLYGTSASAAHAAAVAALILESDRESCEADTNLLPVDVYNKMKQSATDMFPLGGTQDDKFDYNTGYGFINALAALSPEPTIVPTPEPTTPAPTTPSPTPEATLAPTTPSPTPEATTPEPTAEATTPEPEPTPEPTTKEPEPTLSPTQSPSTSPVDPTGTGNFFDYIVDLIRSFIQAIIDAILSLFSL